MKRLAALAVLTLILAIPATKARADFSQDFQVDTSGWFTFAGHTGTVNQEPDGYVSPDYASGITSASPTNHARLRRGECSRRPHRRRGTHRRVRWAVHAMGWVQLGLDGRLHHPGRRLSRRRLCDREPRLVPGEHRLPHGQPERHLL